MCTINTEYPHEGECQICRLKLGPYLIYSDVYSNSKERHKLCEMNGNQICRFCFLRELVVRDFQCSNCKNKIEQVTYGYSRFCTRQLDTQLEVVRMRGRQMQFPKARGGRMFCPHDIMEDCSCRDCYCPDCLTVARNHPVSKFHLVFRHLLQVSSQEHPNITPDRALFEYLLKVRLLDDDDEIIVSPPPRAARTTTPAGGRASGATYRALINDQPVSLSWQTSNFADFEAEVLAGAAVSPGTWTIWYKSAFTNEELLVYDQDSLDAYLFELTKGHVTTKTGNQGKVALSVLTHEEAFRSTRSPATPEDRRQRSQLLHQCEEFLGRPMTLEEEWYLWVLVNSCKGDYAVSSGNIEEKYSDDRWVNQDRRLQETDPADPKRPRVRKDIVVRWIEEIEGIEGIEPPQKWFQVQMRHLDGELQEYLYCRASDSVERDPKAIRTDWTELDTVRGEYLLFEVCKAEGRNDLNPDVTY